MFATVATQGRNVHQRISGLSGIRLTLSKAKEMQKKYEGRNVSTYNHKQTYTSNSPLRILRIPDNETEVSELLKIANTKNAIKNHKARFSNIQLIRLSFLEDGSEYISGIFDTLRDYRESYGPGEPIEIIYKTDKLYLSGERPQDLTEDIFGVYDEEEKRE